MKKLNITVLVAEKLRRAGGGYTSIVLDDSSKAFLERDETLFKSRNALTGSLSDIRSFTLGVEKTPVWIKGGGLWGEGGGYEDEFIINYDELPPIVRPGVKVWFENFGQKFCENQEAIK